MASTTKDLGRVMPVAQGAYSANKAYTPLDIVSYNGGSYICLAANTGKAPTDMTCWQSLAMRGSVGPAGPAGKDGATGAKGDTGATGPSGPKGDTGNTGATGAQGPQGIKGDTGATGPKGANGQSVWYTPYDRAANLKGSYWLDLRPTPTTANPPKIGDLIVNLVGNVFQITKVDNIGNYAYGGGTFDYGDLLTSIKGAKGDAGAQGPRGLQGIQGPKGDTGATGSTGPQGAQGVKGDTGPTGPQGPQGPAGEDSASMIIDNGGNTTNGRGVDCPPAYYQTNYPAKEVKEFKQTANIGLSLINGQTSSYCILTTRVPGTNTGFGWPRQIAETTSSTRPLTYVRIGTSDTVWSAWELMTTW